METIVNSPVTITSTALTEVKRLMNETGFEKDSYLRLGVKGGGCTGLSYVLEFGKPEAGDQVYDIEGVPVIMSEAHSMYLYGMEVDYQGGLNSRGFVFHNPNASKTCGCGSSFAV